MCWRNTLGCRAGRERRGELVTHATRFAGVIFPLPDVPRAQDPQRRVRGVLAYRRSLDPQRIGKTQTGTMRNRVALLPTCFAFHCLLERGRRAGQHPYPLDVPEAGDTPPHPQAAFLFWCARTASVPPSPVSHKNPSYPARHATLQRRLLFFLFPHRELGCGDDTSDDASSI